MTLTLSPEVYRRFLMGKQGLWPGRRWRGIEGIKQAVRECQLIQMDPLVALHRAHDIALWGRVADYSPDLLMRAMYKDRDLFDWGTTLHIYPMEELPYWRGGPMRWKAQYGRIDEIAQQHPDVIDQVRAALRERSPLGQRDFSGEASKIYTYRSGKVPGLALYYLWIAGEVMTHSRKNFDRLYAFTEDVAPKEHQWIAEPEQAWGYIFRKTIRTMGMIPEKQFHKTLEYWMQSRLGSLGDQPLKELYESGDITKVQVEHLKGTFLVMTEDLPHIEDLMAGRVPQAWQPIGATTSDEVTFLAPLEMVSARGRAKEVFDFEYIWEVYKPAEKRKWGYYVLPILYGDRLVARADMKLDRKTRTLHVLGFWLEDHQPADAAFMTAFGRGLSNFTRFHEAQSVDLSGMGDLARSLKLDLVAG